MRFIVDTNVPVVANRAAPHVSPGCVIACTRRLDELCQSQTLVLDDGWHILGEYRLHLRSVGQPGVGDAFLKWVLTNLRNPRRVDYVHLTPRADGADSPEFIEFPSDAALQGFDRSDRKFVAAALAHPDHPPVLNASDTDWWHYRQALNLHGVQIEFVCPDAMPDGTG
jgi:hypothetical protein